MLTFPILIVILAIIFVFRAVRIVPQGYEYTLERFGKYVRTLRPGLHIIIPLIDRVGHKVNMMENVFTVPSQDVITKDNAAVTVDGIVFFQVLDAAQSAYEVTNLINAILNLTMTNIRTVMGSMDLDELLSHRETINARLLTVVDEATNPWGTKVTRIEIKDIKPPRDLVESMGRQMKAERDKRALILEAEGEKQASILRAEGVKQSMILEAEGRRDAAQRDAEARERLAQAEGKAVTSVSDAITAGTPQAINYFVAQKYVEAVRSFADSKQQKLMILPLEAAGLMGTVSAMVNMVQDMAQTQEKKS